MSANIERISTEEDAEKNLISILHIEEKRPSAQEITSLPDIELSLKQVARSNPVAKWTRARLHLYLICFCLFLTSTLNGYDGSLMTSINTLDEYRAYFNLKESASDTGLVFCIYPAGAICSVAFIWLSDYIGRVKTMAVGMVGVVGASILVSATSNHDAFIAGRFFIAFFSTIALSAAPMYIVEMLPPDLSFLIGCFNSCYYIGSIIATWAMYGTSIHYRGSPNSFKIGLWLQLLCPGIVLCFLWSFPESPRYLYSKNKPEEAEAFLVKYHANGEENHPIVRLEMQQISQSFKANKVLKPKEYLDFRVFFNTKVGRKRFFLVLAWSWFNQFSGNQVITYYMTTLFLKLGITNATTRLLLTAINSILCFLFATGGGLLRDKIPRRPMLLYANGGFIICFAVLAGTMKAFEDDPTNKKAAAVGIAFIYIFMAVFFSFAFTSLQPIYPSEIMSNEMRTRGMTIYFLVSNVAAFVNLYSAPTAMQNIKYWYYVFFVFWDTFQFIVIYLFFVETCCLTLEEIEKVYESGSTVKESIRMSKLARAKRTEKDPV